MKSLLATTLLLLCFVSWSGAQPDKLKPGVNPSGPYSPREALTTFRLLKGFKIDLAACEPDVVDPVAMAFDEHGRIFVAEMIGYPNEGVATGFIVSGQIKMLEDRDGDGFYEKSTLFADKLRFPTSVMPWKGGLLVANAPDLIYLEDTNGDGRADQRRVLYTGFELYNIQQLINGLQWGMDNWVYGCAGAKGGEVKSAEKPDAPALTLRARGVRFHPDKPGSLEPTSGGGQFGLAPDDWQNWFTATNSQHLRHIVLPDHYLRRNPNLPVSAVILDIPDHGPACKVHRISPFEAWRVERTTRRKEGADAKRFAATELIPGGFVTSGTSPLVYCADLFPSTYRDNVFVCDPANNLIHRDILEPNGATFVAKRADADCEFLASTDNWFRPVNLTLGPDGAIYVLDFYREIIETPLSLPEDIKQRWNLQSRGKGRIWRITPEASKLTRRPMPGMMKGAELVPLLAENNIWWRLNAQRLLMERNDASVIPAVRQLFETTNFAPGRAHALWTLHGLGGLQAKDVERALSDADAGVRGQALRLSEGFLATSPAIQQAAAKLADDPSPRVRFQAAFSLGEVHTPETIRGLLRIAGRSDTDSWTQTAVLSSAGRSGSAMFDAFVSDGRLLNAASPAFLTRLASLAGASADDESLSRILTIVALNRGPQQLALLTGLGQGLQNSKRSMDKLWEAPPKALQQAVAAVKPLFAEAGERARSEKQTAEDRAAAARILGFAPFALASKVLPELLAPQQPQELQLAAVRALSQHVQAKVAGLVLESWSSYSPVVRREVLEAVFSRPDRVKVLLDHIEQKKVVAGQLEPARLDQLRKLPDVKLRARATKLLAGAVTPARAKVVEDYQPALELKGNPVIGKAIFKKTCATCHRLENEGIEVGADLQSILPNKRPETLLIDVLDPSREVDPRYIEYLVTLKSGKVLSGLISSETATSVTLRRAEKAEDTILRSQIDEIRATAKSLMPEGLEMQMNRQEFADLVAYLMTIGRK